MENNKLIAEFLGWSINSDGTFNTPFNWIDEFASMSWNKYRDDFEADKMLFHSDWNWLMLVVEKIESIEMNDGRTFTIDFYRDSVLIFEYGLTNNELIFTEGSGRRENLYNTCIEFIKWYNENGR